MSDQDLRVGGTEELIQPEDATFVDFEGSKETQLSNLLIGISAAIVCACITEGINWYLIYRHDEYKKLTSDILESQDKVDKLKDKLLFSQGTLTDAQRKAQGRKVAAAEGGLRSQQSQLMARKSRGMLIVGIFSLVFVSMLSRAFYGQVVVRLPFVPFGFMSNMTHYGLTGEDYTEASMTMVFVLSNLSFGAYVKKLLGLEGPRITMPQQQNPWG